MLLDQDAFDDLPAALDAIAASECLGITEANIHQQQEGEQQ